MEERRERTSKVGNVVVAAAAGSGCFRRHYFRARSMRKDDGSEDARDDHVISRSQATRECVEVNAGGEQEDVCEVDCRRGTSVSHSLLVGVATLGWLNSFVGLAAAPPSSSASGLGLALSIIRVVSQRATQPSHLFVSSPQPAIMHDPSAIVELLFLSESLKLPRLKHIKPQDVVARRQKAHTCHEHGSEGALSHSSCLANRL